MRTYTELRDEQASRILDALDKCVTPAQPITIYLEESTGRVGVRWSTTGHTTGTSVRDALANMLQGRT
jgi:hypothetical protein